MNKFTKIALGAGLLGATLLGTALPATAAPANPKSMSTQAVGDRLSTKLYWQTYANGVSDDRYTVLGQSKAGEHFETKRGFVTTTDFTMPPVNVEGPLRDASSGLCATVPDNANSDGHYVITAEKCADLPSQKWVLLRTAHDTPRYLLVSPGVSGHILSFATGEMILSPYEITSRLYLRGGFTPVAGDEDDSATDVKFTTPENNAVVSKQPTFAGKGEPGASVSLTDGDGVAYGTTEVDQDGNWGFVLMDAMTPGQKTMTATQTDSNGNVTTATLDITVADEADTPIIDPMVAAAAGGVLALGLAGTVLVRRRIKA